MLWLELLEIAVALVVSPRLGGAEEWKERIEFLKCNAPAVNKISGTRRARLRCAPAVRALTWL
jgi:hypothetical protein